MKSSISNIGQNSPVSNHPRTLHEIGGLWEGYLYQTRPYGTYERYSRAVAKFLDKFPDARSIHDFLRPQVMSYIEARLAEGASVSTVRLELSAIRSFFQFAYDLGEALINPATNVRVPNRIKRLKRSDCEHTSLSISATGGMISPCGERDDSSDGDSA